MTPPGTIHSTDQHLPEREILARYCIMSVPYSIVSTIVLVFNKPQIVAISQKPTKVVSIRSI